MARIELVTPLANYQNILTRGGGGDSEKLLLLKVFLSHIQGFKKVMILVTLKSQILMHHFVVFLEITQCFREQGEECPFGQICGQDSDGFYECICHEGQEVTFSEGKSICQGKNLQSSLIN